MYSDGKEKVWLPWESMFGRNPAFGIMFQDKVSVTFLFPLEQLKKESFFLTILIV